MLSMCRHVQDCLRDKAVSVSWECQEELFRQEVENADDLRLSQRLFKKCMGDKRKFCSDIKFGVLHCAPLPGTCIAAKACLWSSALSRAVS